MNTSWLCEKARVSATQVQGFVWNPTAGHLPPPEDDGRAYVHVMVEGRAVLLASGEVLEPGDVLVCGSYADTFQQSALASIEDHKAVAVRVDPSGFTVQGPRLERVPVDTVRSIHARLAQARTAREASVPGQEVLALLRDHGILPWLDGGAGSRSESEDDAVAAGITRAMTVNATRPAMTDLTHAELAVSERHMRRRLQDFFLRYRVPFPSWRAMRSSFSLTTAALAMTTPGASTQLVAKLTGFSSSTSLCHALQRAGMRSPLGLAAGAAALRANL